LRACDHCGKRYRGPGCSATPAENSPAASAYCSKDCCSMAGLVRSAKERKACKDAASAAPTTDVSEAFRAGFDRALKAVAQQRQQRAPASVY